MIGKVTFGMLAVLAVLMLSASVWLAGNRGIVYITRGPELRERSSDAPVPQASPQPHNWITDVRPEVQTVWTGKGNAYVVPAPADDPPRFGQSIPNTVG